jgi:pimeloyl-ACP methyl ester carboxylesterase
MPFLNRAGVDLWYEVVDAVAPWNTSPSTIVFHHGVAMSSGLWRAWLPALVDRYRVVMFDMRGYGRSGHQPQGTAWSMDLLADDLGAVADAAGAQRFHLVGESIGGTVAMVYALRHPHRVASLAVSNGSPRGLQVRNIAGWRETMAQKGQEAWADEVMARRFHEGQLDAGRWQWAWRQHVDCSAQACVELGELLARADITERLAELGMPTLLLSPDGSPFIPAAVMLDMAARIPGAELKVFPHAKHGLPLSHATECAATLREFLGRRCTVQP